MIIQNGYIEAVTVVNGGIDQETGYPLAGGMSFGSPIACQYFLKSNRQAVLANGERKETEQYQILVEEQPCCFNPEKVRLTDMCGNTVGVFVVETVEPLEAVSEVRLTVKIR